jgi:hypothetical protein
MRAFLLLVLAVSCKDSASATADGASVTEAAAPAPVTAEIDSHGKWWAVASKSQVYTGQRRTDADNALRLLPDDKRNKVRRSLDDMAGQTHDADGLRAASQIARDGQERVEDAHDPAAKTALTTAAFIVLHGLIALACTEHTDVASLRDVMAEIREMPLPHLEKGNGISERLVLEQEMKMNVDDKVMKGILASAPGPKKSL